MINVQEHHFVPAFYLRGFGFKYDRSKKNEFVFEYDKNSNVAPKKPRSVKEVCKIPNHNCIELEDGNVDNRAEEAFSQVENKICRLIRKIAPENDQFITLTNEQRADISHFIAFMFLRNPAFRDGAEEAKKEILYSILENSIREKPDEVPEEIRRGAEEKGLRNFLDIKIAKWASLDVFNQQKLIAGALLRSKYWYFYIAPKNATFVTSDNPVIFHFPNLNRNFPGGIAHPLSEVIFPIRSEVLLICKPNHGLNQEMIKAVDMRAREITLQELKYFNRIIAAAALKNVYSNVSRDALARMVYNQRNSAQKLIVN